MRSFILLAAAMVSGAAAFGQGLLDCVDPDVLRALLLQSQAEGAPIITAAVPLEIASLKMPAGFTWIGSAERITGRADASTNTSQVTASWRSNLAPNAARAATTTALTASGWALRSMSGFGMNVFISTEAQGSQTACRDGKPVNMNITAMDGVTYVLFTIQRGSTGNTICNQPDRPSSGVTTSLEGYLPRLNMPVDPATGVSVRNLGGGGSGSAGNQTARAEFSTKDSVGNIARYFAKQMSEQGWSSDASWSGVSTAGSSWSRRSDAGGIIQSTLTVTAVEEGQFVTALRVLRLQ
jgi:hypothetical protein